MPDTPASSENNLTSDSQTTPGVETEFYNLFSMSAPPSFGLPLVLPHERRRWLTPTLILSGRLDPFVEETILDIRDGQARAVQSPVMVLWRCSKNDLLIIGESSKRLASLVESEPPNRWWGPHILCRRHSRLAGRPMTPGVIGLVPRNHPPLSMISTIRSEKFWVCHQTQTTPLWEGL